jgi:hypothetical protein
MKELFLYLLAAISGLTILGYSVHMLVGGLVSKNTEYALIAGACLSGFMVLLYMVWDVLRQRHIRGDKHRD